MIGFQHDLNPRRVAASKLQAYMSYHTPQTMPLYSVTPQCLVTNEKSS